ncbi:hypothetical protein [Ornithinimicrobium kibberense]|uniref:hypothetical protein n=1 Tax=Ornithinimicrobium kibberense TaxID=282060 RepID=UPI00361F9CB3
MGQWPHGLPLTVTPGCPHGTRTKGPPTCTSSSPLSSPPSAATSSTWSPGRTDEAHPCDAGPTWGRRPRVRAGGSLHPPARRPGHRRLLVGMDPGGRGRPPGPGGRAGPRGARGRRGGPPRARSRAAPGGLRGDGRARGRSAPGGTVGGGPRRWGLLRAGPTPNPLADEVLQRRDDGLPRRRRWAGLPYAGRGPGPGCGPGLPSRPAAEGGAAAAAGLRRDDGTQRGGHRLDVALHEGHSRPGDGGPCAAQPGVGLSVPRGDRLPLRGAVGAGPPRGPQCPLRARAAPRRALVDRPGGGCPSGAPGDGDHLRGRPGEG